MFVFILYRNFGEYDRSGSIWKPAPGPGDNESCWGQSNEKNESGTKRTVFVSCFSAFDAGDVKTFWLTSNKNMDPDFRLPQPHSFQIRVQAQALQQTPSRSSVNFDRSKLPIPNTTNTKLIIINSQSSETKLTPGPSPLVIALVKFRVHGVEFGV